MSKFKNTEELKKAYEELEREFTKKSQKLAESEKSEETYKSMFEIGVENNHSLLKEIEQLKQQLAEKEKLLNQYPYKNDVIEKQYEDLKDGIKFRIENNITDDWEQHYHCIDILCEKHKARIRYVENGICKIEELEKLLNAKEKMKTQSLKGFEKLKQQLADKDNEIEVLNVRINTMQEDINYWEKQLAELEKINDKLGTDLYNTENICSYLQQQLAEKEVEND